MNGPQTCAVCGETVSKYIWHARLGVAVCSTCPKTDVCGEDITMHTVMWFGYGYMETR